MRLVRRGWKVAGQLVGWQFHLGRLGDFAIQIAQSDGEMESVHGREVDNRLGTCELRFRGWLAGGSHLGNLGRLWNSNGTKRWG